MSEDNVVVLNVMTTNHISPNRVIQGAEERCKEVVVVGWDNDKEFFFSTSCESKYEILWLLENAKKTVMSW